MSIASPGAGQEAHKQLTLASWTHAECQEVFPYKSSKQKPRAKQTLLIFRPFWALKVSSKTGTHAKNAENWALFYEFRTRQEIKYKIPDFLSEFSQNSSMQLHKLEENKLPCFFQSNWYHHCCWNKHNCKQLQSSP